ncbi:MAG: 3-dehydroquinate synthase [Planctomycetes bacterium]|nr:3-dehydroquinate synthase [Planctomycetota bacterium]
MPTICIAVPLEPRYEVLVGRGLLAETASRSAHYSARALLSDTHVAPLYAGALGLPEATRAHLLTPGESSKNLDELERTLEFMARTGLDRSACLLLLGGGVVGDLGGLAAALYMRGIDFVQLPTTLLAQVDSSVGGKTAVNLAAGKNLAGVFRQPALVLADTGTLATLDAEEYRSGLGEVLKTALVAGEALLARLESARAELAARDPDLLAEVVAECVRTKAAIVARDPTEKGERAKLNLGHTFAHAIERVAGYGAIPHGVAVGTGLALALRLSERLQIVREPALRARVEALLAAFGIPTTLAALRTRYHAQLEPSELVRSMRLDKKSVAGRPRFVLPRAVGELALGIELEDSALETVLEAA